MLRFCCFSSSYKSFHSLVLKPIIRTQIPHRSYNNLLRIKPISKISPLWVVIGSTGYIGVKCIFNSHNIAYCEQREIIKDPKNKFDWKKLLSYISPDILNLLTAIIAAFIVALCNLSIPTYLQKLINTILQFARENIQFNYVELSIPLSKLLVLYLAQGISTFICISMLSNVGENVAIRMRYNLFSSILQQELEFFDKTRTGDILQRLTTDVQEFKSSFKLVIIQGLKNVTQLIGGIYTLYNTSPEMTVAVAVVLPSIIVIGTFFGSILRKLSKQAQEQNTKATIIAEEVVGNIRTVRAFASEHEECERFLREIENNGLLHKKLGYGIGLFQAGSNIFLNGIVLGTIFLGGKLMTTSKLDPGQLMSFLMVTQMLQHSMAQFSLLFGHYVKGIAAGSRIFEFIEKIPKSPLSGGLKIPYHTFKPEIEFENVTFSYPTRSDQIILNNFNLKVAPGKTVAVVGSSGNGKSTIAALLMRFYDVNSGSIKVSGEDIKNIDQTWFRKRAIGLINQEPILFAISILENIRYGKPDAKDEEVIEAAKIANAHPFITSFPNGYNTIVGERGVTVSGGQKQRIAIARAILKNPYILVLDEATSALDTESEMLVQSAIESISKGKTTLVIAHRLSTVKNADIIVVLNKGEIVEIGNHENLLKKKGFYWNLMNQQTSNKAKAA
ncbi:mitochondrial potassium channel ATP-binding subunit [Daktulosphaira vitifoliae]|uniref:mitochondrial potassium channel ATP-binding subunit n=1 Tax=Daktulosphaira vitifoliae TaxID=58002 RepID=UPI0021AA9B89|nr:mitochondrial potassium channel ATP-binding subunit [Daktulosphaira vitifoliae]